ncbi:MAG: glycoside hydrolase family 18 protein [Imperialibacter sp.]|uniref:glycoside hydrolase family 18 protein n=1 Tax=Imperialibacter sp. TaxID=2038411 RepID=UPI003A83F411
MKKSLYYIFALCLLFHSCRQEPPKEAVGTPTSNKEIIGYVPGFRGLLDEKDIDANKLTIINYAFVDVKDSLAWLTNLETDSVNFRKLNYLKKDNPDLKIVISIGGWSWSENFSDAVLTASSREKFAKSGTKIVSDYNLDGIDIDWEYPGLKGEDNVFRDEDRENFTLMFEAIRKELDALAVTTGKKYIVSTALPCFPRLFEVTNMGDVAKHIDFVNIMAYDFYVAGDTVGHHSNLYPSENYEKENSADKAVKTYIEQGVPAEKLVLGVPFYGRSWTMKSSDNLGILRPRDEVMRGGGFTFIKDSLMAKPGFVRYWDDAAKSPYLFNAGNNQLVVYDDESSVKLKCEYVNDNGLAGIMFWQYASDPKEYLLDVVNEHLD